jgi:thermostable 8-oxoguanine DNA glycosylase
MARPIQIPSPYQIALVTFILYAGKIFSAPDRVKTVRFNRPFDFNRKQVGTLKSFVSQYYDVTKAQMPVHGAWRSMDSEELWKHLLRIIIAMGRSAPSYRLIASPDFERLTLRSMKVFQDKNGTDALVKRVHETLARYGVRYCSPKKETSLKARAIAANLNEPAVVDGAEFVLLKNMRNAADPRRYLMDEVHGYGMKSASEFLTEIGYSQDYMAFDSRLKRAFTLLFDRDFDRIINTQWDYRDVETVFREEICPELGIRPPELDAIVFWNYGDILKSLKSQQNK